MCENEYPGLKENLERFKNDLQDEKTRILFKIAYKQGHDAGQVDAHVIGKNDEKDTKYVARQMHATLCAEIVEIAKRNIGKSLEEADEYDRVKEIFELTKLLEKEYGLEK